MKITAKGVEESTAKLIQKGSIVLEECKIINIDW